MLKLRGEGSSELVFQLEEVGEASGARFGVFAVLRTGDWVLNGFLEADLSGADRLERL
jgi:hypothetical protein